MVVLAASITTRAGKPLLSRQFKDITKDRVTELLSNFQNLVANSNSQHTFVEDEHVRYVYKPFEDFFIILITNRQSNIIQDLDTLNLFSQTVNATLRGFDENDIFHNAFEILGSFDEIISMGYKENLSLSQIQTFLSMESHEEMIQEIIDRGKEFDAKEQRKRAAKEIMRKEHDRRMGGGQYSEYLDQPKFGTNNNQTNMNDAYNSYYSNASNAAQQSYQHLQKQQQQQQQQHPHQHSPVAEVASTHTSQKRGRISKIGSTPASNIIITQGLIDEPENTSGVLITTKETISAQITREGDITSSELKGVLELRVNDSQYGKISIQLDSNKVDFKSKALNFKTHPNIDKKQFLQDGVIGLKDSNKSFPPNDQSLGVLRWRKTGGSDDDSIIPLKVSTWVSESSNGLTVTFEYELNEDSYNGGQLQDIYFIIPILNATASVTDGDAIIKGYDDEQGIVLYVKDLQQGEPGVFNVEIENVEDEDSLFPINVTFINPNGSSDISLCGVTADQIVNTEDGQPIEYQALSTLKNDEYVVV